MHLRLKRRRFGQLALASAATTVLSNLATKTNAQQSQLAIYGVRLTPACTNITADQVGASAANKTPGIILQSVDLVNNQELFTREISEQIVQNQQEPTQTTNQAFTIKQCSERITGFTVLSDGRFVAAVSAVTQQGQFSRFILFNEDMKNTPTALKARKIKKNHTVESLLAIQNDQIVSVVSQNQGQPPFELSVIDLKSGQINSGASLGLPNPPSHARFSNLAQSPDGTIYATTMDSEGVPILVSLDLQNRSSITGRGKINKLMQLTFNNSPVNSDLVGLAFSPSNQLFALADPKNEGTNSLFTVDLNTGAMQFVRKFAVDKIAFKKA